MGDVGGDDELGGDAVTMREKRKLRPGVSWNSGGIALAIIHREINR